MTQPRSLTGGGNRVSASVPASRFPPHRGEVTAWFEDLVVPPKDLWVGAEDRRAGRTSRARRRVDLITPSQPGSRGSGPRCAVDGGRREGAALRGSGAARSRRTCELDVKEPNPEPGPTLAGGDGPRDAAALASSALSGVNAPGTRGRTCQRSLVRQRTIEESGAAAAARRGRRRGRSRQNRLCHTGRAEPRTGPAGDVRAVSGRSRQNRPCWPAICSASPSLGLGDPSRWHQRSPTTKRSAGGIDVVFQLDVGLDADTLLDALSTG